MLNWVRFDKKLPILLVASLLLVSLVVTGASQDEVVGLAGSELPEKYVIEDVPYVPMYSYWSTCAMSSLEMALEYYGYDYSIMTLMNLGWQYGATLVENENGPVLMPGAEQPTEGIIHAAEVLGFTLNEQNNQEKEEAWRTLKSHLVEDTPVIIQWTMHTVLAVGYDETGEEEVIFHNPASPRRLLEGYMGIKEDLNTDPGKLSTMGKSKLFGVDYWVNANSYPAKRYEMITLDPPAKRKEIRWKDVIDRNSEKTLGKGDWSSYPPYVWYSVDAFNEAAKNVESGEWSEEELSSLFSASDWGPASRSHVASFLAGFGQRAGIEELKRAGRLFEKSGYYWQEAREIWNYVYENPHKIKENAYRKVISDAFRKVASHEERAGKALAQAGKKFQLKHQGQG